LSKRLWQTSKKKKKKKMYNAPAPAYNAGTDYDFVAASRRPVTQARLSALRAPVMTAYSDYLAHAHRIDLLPKMAGVCSSDRTLLRSNFTRMDTGKPCSSIRTEILSRTKDSKCPYCRLTDASTLDHILEKGPYPEHSVLRANLAPVCERCNTLKETNKKLVAGRHTFHLYFDGYPFKDFLTATPHYSDKRAWFEFKLTNPGGIGAQHWDALEAHFIRLGLAKRYRSRARTEMGDRRHLLQKLHKKKGPDAVAKNLRSYAKSVALNWSNQDWLCVMLLAGAEDKDFCDKGIFKI
jgi:hypothetical protein